VADGVIYLASPYSHPSRSMRSYRFLQACRAAARLMRKGHVVFSPIAHSHPVARYGGLDEMDGALWQQQDAPMLALAHEVWVLMIEGWRESRGIQAEIAWAVEHGRAVRYLNEDADEPIEVAA